VSEEIVTIDGVRLAYRRLGDPAAGTLILLHGLGSDATGLLDLAALLRGWQLVLPDLPGYGRSAPLPGEHTLLRYAGVVDGLRRALGLSRFALLGHSLGADVALTYAGTYRLTVESLCLLNPVVGAGGASARLARLFGDMATRLPDPAGRLLMASRPAVYLSDRALFTTRDRALRERILRQDYGTARLADSRALRESYRSVRETPFAWYARRIRAGTLLVTGSRDTLATVGSIRRLPWPAGRTRLEVVPGAGHLLPIEQPEAAAVLLQDFLGGEPVPAAA